MGAGFRDLETLGPGTQGPPQSLKVRPGTSLKFKSWTPGPPSKFKSGTLGPPPKFKSGTPHLSLMNFYFSEYFIVFFYLFIFCVFLFVFGYLNYMYVFVCGNCLAKTLFFTFNRSVSNAQFFF